MTYRFPRSGEHTTLMIFTYDMAHKCEFLQQSVGMTCSFVTVCRSEIQKEIQEGKKKIQQQGVCNSDRDMSIVFLLCSHLVSSLLTVHLSLRPGVSTDGHREALFRIQRQQMTINIMDKHACSVCVVCVCVYVCVCDVTLHSSFTVESIPVGLFVVRLLLWYLQF